MDRLIVTRIVGRCCLLLALVLTLTLALGLFLPLTLGLFIFELSIISGLIVVAALLVSLPAVLAGENHGRERDPCERD